MFFFQAEDGIRDIGVTGVQTCALPILIGQWVSEFDQVVDAPVRALHEQNRARPYVDPLAHQEGNLNDLERAIRMVRPAGKQPTAPKRNRIRAVQCAILKDTYREDWADRKS